MRVRFRLSRNSRTVMVCVALMLGVTFAGSHATSAPR